MLKIILGYQTWVKRTEMHLAEFRIRQIYDFHKARKSSFLYTHIKRVVTIITEDFYLTIKLLYRYNNAVCCVAYSIRISLAYIIGEILYDLIKLIIVL